MTTARLSQLLFAVGRLRPALPLRILRALPLPLIHAVRALGIHATLRTAARSAFYREAFARHGLDPGRVSRLDQLRDFSLPAAVLKSRPEALLCGTPDLAIESSGTSGHVTRVYLSRDELDYNAGQGALLRAVYGLTSADRLLCTLDWAWGLGALLVERGARSMGVFTMVPGRVDAHEAYDRFATYGFTVVVSDPFWLARFTEVARERGRPGSLKLMIGGGEGLTARARAELERFWDARVCMTYASTEAATVLGFECLAGAGYHVNEFDFLVEVDAPDAAGYGEVLFTTVHRRVMPLIRFRTGDVARWLPGPCTCGMPFRRLSTFRERVDEQVSCVWGNLAPDFFEGLLGDSVDALGDWQVALYEREGKPVFQFRLEGAGDADCRRTVVDKVERSLRLRHPEAWRAYGQHLTDIEFAFLPGGTLRTQRKLLRLVDERDEEPHVWNAPIVAARRPA